MTILAFDVETRRLATEVEAEFREKLRGESPWARPDLFGFAVGVAVDVENGLAMRFGPEEPMMSAREMAATLAGADRIVSYNGEAFDLKVLLEHADDWPVVREYVEKVRAKHLDINLAVMAALDEHPLAAEPGIDRIRQSGLDGLARANNLEGKTASGTAVPAMLREGRVEEVLGYCEHDTRLIASLYRIASKTGRLVVDGHTKVDGERVELGRLEVPIALPC